MNRQKAKDDFVWISKKANYDGVESFSKKYNIKRDKKSCFSWYSSETFFYQILNKGLRVFSTPKQMAYLRLPFSDIFLSVLELYNEQRAFHDSFVCYRGCKLSEEQINELHRSVGGFIQMQGFVSTSMRKQVVISYCKNKGNTIIQIKVPQKNDVLEDEGLDFGFADISAFSNFGHEKQILFNSINIFQVQAIENQIIEHYDHSIEIKVVKLNYVRIESIKSQERILTEDERELLAYLQYQKKIFKQIENQGDAFFSLGQYTDAQQWFEQSINCFQGKLQQLGKELNYFEEQEKRGIEERLWKSYLKISITENNLGNYQKAKIYLQNCLSRYNTFPHKTSCKMNKILDIQSKVSRNLEEKVDQKIKQSYIDESVDEKLKEIIQRQGKKHPLYFSYLHLKIKQEAESNNWEKVIEKGNQFMKYNKAKNSEVTQILYLLSFSFLQKGKIITAQVRFEEFIQSLSNTITMTEMGMFIMLISNMFEDLNNKEQLMVQLQKLSKYEVQKAKSAKEKQYQRYIIEQLEEIQKTPSIIEEDKKIFQKLFSISSP